MGASTVARIAWGVESNEWPRIKSWPGNRASGGLSSPQYIYDGGVTGHWAAGTGGYRNRFRAMARRFPWTNVIWYMHANRKGDTADEVEVEAVVNWARSAMAEIHPLGKSPLVIVSGLPVFTSGTCFVEPPDADTTPALTRQHAQDAVTSIGDSSVAVYAEASTVFTDIDTADTTDGCHQDETLRATHGGELATHLESL